MSGYAVGKFTHEKYGRPPRVIRFRCFVRFAGSLPLTPAPSPPPPALVSPGCLYISIPDTVRSLFIYRFNEHVRDKASRNIDIGWSIPARLARSLVWRVLHLSLGKTKDRPIAISPGVSETHTLSTRYRDIGSRAISRFVGQTTRLAFVKLYVSIFFIESVERRV